MFKQTAAGLFALSLAAVAQAEVKEFNWDATWVWGAPDGFGRPLIGINNQWPLPTIRASVGDIIRVHLTNKLGNQTTGIHWHGINQISTSWMDGANMVTQCPIPPNMTFTYSFEADVAGTYWYHSHDMGQYPDGLRAPLIIDPKEDPYAGQYDEEYIITVSDWYHQQSLGLVQAMLSPDNPRGLPPFPDNLLLNDGQFNDYVFDKTKTYRFRIISLSAFTSFMISIDQHDMTVIMNDASTVNNQVVSQLRITPGQRYDVLVKGKDSDSGNYEWLFALDENRDYTVDTALTWPLNASAFLGSDPSGDRPLYTVDLFAPADDSKWSTATNEVALPAADKTFQMSFESCLDSFGIPRICLNGSPYVTQKVPTLYTASSVGVANENVTVYGDVHPFIVNYGDVVDIVVNNLEAAIHPFHLHGHHFQVLSRPSSGTGIWPGESAPIASNPPRRDTVSVMGNSYLHLRYEANNPGVYLFHCHIEWHVEMGLTATIIEAPEMLRNLPIPADQIAACKALDIPYKGNAGGNVVDPFDTSNYNTAPPENYIGATYVPPASCPAKRRVKKRAHAKKALL